MDKVTPEDYIANLWRSVKAGAISWQEVALLQADAMPRCEPHNAPANVKIGGVPLCTECIEARYAKP
jgi:hypothetical protein